MVDPGLSNWHCTVVSSTVGQDVVASFQEEEREEPRINIR